MKLKHYLFSVILFGLYCNISVAQVAVPFTQRLAGGSVKIKGDIMFVGNQITNTIDNIPGHTTTNPNIPYTGTDNNNGHAFGYVDIDGDPVTFSSSSSDLNITGTCRKIRYAGLYWTATYPFEVSGPGGNGTSSNYTGSPRMNDWNNVKFKVPGGAYVDLTADTAADPVGQEDDIIFDGYNAANPSNSFYAAPYVCYKNVTSLLQALANPNGTYTVANVRAARGIRPDGISSGWSLVVIYDDPALPSKYISVFDGYANIAGANVDFNVNGFQTLPSPLPVRARIGVSTLEGDYSITGDNLRFKANLSPGFTNITNGLNPLNNFFNGSITTNNVTVLTRNPASTNTLGFDLDLVNVNNPAGGAPPFLGGSVVPNGETGGTIRLTTSGDAYGTYLTTFDVEIIEPKIVLTKTVQNAAGVDIGSTDVNLCQDLQYVIGYQNIGNDDAQNFTIRDVLPINVTFNPATDLVLPPGVTYTYTAGTRTIIFNIPNNQVNIGDPRQEIRIKVKVVCSCYDLDDACSNLVQNQAFATYQGVLNTDQITDDPSLSSYTICNSGTPSPTNFLVGLDDCDFTHTVEICGNNPITLTAANGYQSYVWTASGGGHIVSGANSQTVTIDQPGTYTVNDNINTSPCKSIVETYIVTAFTGGVLTNPVIPYADQVVTCPNDGKPLPYIFLCGAGDTQLIQTSIAGATSIEWQQLNTASCAAVTNPNCANENPACTWNTIATGPNYTANIAGEFRIKINFPNGCSRIFYFNVYQNLLNPIYTVTDIICTTQGNITVTNVPAGYEYQLINAVTSAVVRPWQASNIFNGLPAGTYIVQVRQVGVPGGCVFSSNVLGIRARNFTVTYSILQQPLCTGDKGSISISANDVRPQYTFSIYLGAVLVATSGPINSNNYVFNNLNPGNYTYVVTTQDGCNATGPFTITTPPTLSMTLSLTKPLSCTDGEITANVLGGTPPFNFIITPPAPGVPYTQSSNVIAAPTAGTYSVQVVDFNNCKFTSTINVVQVVPPAYTVTSTNIACATAGNTGTITFNVTNANGSALLFSINNGSTWQASNVFTNLAPGTYTAIVQYTTGTSVCTTTPQTITITIPTPIVGTATLTTPYTCTSNGVITVSGVSGGTPGYTYSIGGAYQASNVFSGLTAGTYTVTIKDSAGCTLVLAPIVIPPLTPPTDITFAATALSCPANTSNVTLTVTGGAPALTYQIILPTPGIPQVSNIFNNLAPGTYTFLVTDSKNCTYQESFTINPLPPLTVTPTVIRNVRCFGTNTGSFSFTVSGFAPNFNYTVTPGGFSGTNIATPTVTINNVPAGTYTINVTNPTTNCTTTATVTITQPATALTAALVTSPITCLANGQVTVNASGGWGGYTYSISPVAGTQSGNVFTNLTANTYTITTTDSGGCSVTNTVTLTNPISPTLALSPTSDFCYDAVNAATIVVTAASGVAPYQFSINGGAFVPSNTPVNSHTFTGLTPGVHTIVVKDAYGCTNTIPFTQTINPQLSLSTVITKDLDCTASPNAVITGNITGGYPGYTYQVKIGAGAYGASFPVVGSTFTYSAATANSYQFLVTDSRGCTVQSQVITINPLIPVTQTHTQVNNTCFGGNSGSVTITPGGGVGPYQVNFNGLGFSSTFTYSSLAAGTYNYIVRDSKMCTVNGSVTITQPTQITYTHTVVPIQCNAVGGYTLGQICVNPVTGGTPGYTYTLVDLTGGTPNQNFASPAGAAHCFTGIDFGIYDLIVTDANGCTVVHTNIVMTNPPNDLDIIPTATIPSCAAGATVQVDLVGALPGTYQFAIMNAPPPIYVTLPNVFFAPNNGPFSHIFTGLTPGVVYTFVVRDTTTGCYYFETMTAPTPTNSTIVPTITPKNVTCRNAADGSVSASLSGYGAGATSISYVINYASSGLPVGTPGTSGTMVGPGFSFTNAGPLGPGTYTIYFRELNGANAGCGVTSTTFTISQSATDLSLTATTTNDNCNVNAGQIAVNPVGGTAPYTYQYLLSPSVTPAAGAPGWNATNPFNGESGTYDVYVKDANDCIKKITVVIGLDPTPVVAATIANACATQGNFAINVTLPTTGVAPYTYSIDGGAFVAMTAPFTVSGLSSGAHSVQVRDRNGCGNTVNLTILAPVVASAAFSTQPTCLNADGTITTTASGGSGNYTYTLLTSPGLVVITGPQASNVFASVAAGSYFVRVTDTTTGCTTDVPVSVALPDPVTFTTTFTSPLCNGNNNGTITVTLNAGNNNPTYSYQIIAGPSLAGPQSSNVFTGLVAGTYTVQVTSGRGCSATQNVTVTEPSPVVIASPVAVIPFSCAANNSVNTATITISASGGTTAYTYSINGTNYFTSNVFSVIDTGAVQNITVYVKDANGCIDTELVTINPIVPINASINIIQTIDCTRPQIIQINAAGGSGSYTYQTLPSGAANVTQGVGPLANQFTITTPGTYYFRVIDATTGCYFDTAAHVIPVFNTINVVATAVKPVTCFGGNDGGISINVSGYTGAYSYNILDSASVIIAAGVGNTAVNPLAINGLPAGNYTVQVAESATPFCTKVSNVVTVGSPSAALTISAAETANVTCTNNQGVITATATGGWNTSYTYTISPVAGTQTSPGVFSNLPANSYTITVTDALGCTSSATVVLVQPAPITTTVTASASSVLCFGDNNASITINYPTGGQGSNYTYSLNQTAPTLSSVAFGAPMPLGGVTVNNLAAGTYVVTITDGYNCSFTSLPIVISQPTKVNASLVMTTSPSCTGNTVLTLTGSGGVPPYTYSSDGGLTYNPVPFNPSTTINLTAGTTGTFQYVIKDFNGCVSNVSNGITVDPITPLTLSALSHIDILCGGSATGSITAVANGGLLNYVYSLVDNLGNPILVGTQTSPGVFNNLPAGTYYVHVTSNDCLFTSAPVVITEPTQLTVTQTPIAVTCNGLSNGSVHLVIAGGTGTIQYAISPRLDQFITIQNPYAVGGFDIQNLSAGTYTIIVQDQNGCFVQFNNVVITQPNPIGGTITGIVDETCAEQDLGEFTISGINGGTAPYSVSYDVIYPGTSTVVHGTPVALPLGQTSYTFTNLNGGAYTAIITDAKGCPWSYDFVIGSGDLYDPQANIDLTCVNNQPGVTVTVVNLSNPPSMTFNPLSNFLFSLDVNNVASAQASNVFTSATHPSLLTPGNHTVYVFSALGCDKGTPVFTINPSDVDPLNLTLAQVFLNKIVATATGGQPPYTYTFDNHNNGSNNIYIYDHSGTYTVTVTDATGCSVTKQITVEFIPICIPDFFTPDGDGQNDGWTPGCSENYPNLKTIIYDRYGREVAHLNQGELWDGKYEGKELPSGDYWYVVKVDENFAEQFVGHFTLYR